MNRNVLREVICIYFPEVLFIIFFLDVWVSLSHIVNNDHVILGWQMFGFVAFLH
jgi:hypothetical protein